MISGVRLYLLSTLHNKTKRNYQKRMLSNKVRCMKVARKYSKSYWDGDRKYGYGGYKYDGRWEGMAKKLIEKYGISDFSDIIDLGCGKGHLLYEIKKQQPMCSITGVDISKYAKRTSKVGVCNMDIRETLPFGDKSFDLALCINVIHNFTLPEVKNVLQTIDRIADRAYICVDSYRNEKELYNLQCWSLTAECFLKPEEWEFLFNEWGYKGDYEFIFFK